MSEHNSELYFIAAIDLHNFLNEVGMKGSEFAEIIGVSSGTPNGWIRKNKMPKWVLLAIEALRKAKPSDIRLIVSPGAKLAAVRSILDAMSVPYKEI